MWYQISRSNQDRIVEYTRALLATETQVKFCIVCVQGQLESSLTYMKHVHNTLDSLASSGNECTLQNLIYRFLQVNI